MKAHILLLVWILSIFTAGCSQVTAPEFTPTATFITLQSQPTEQPSTPQEVEMTEDAGFAQVTPLEATPAPTLTVESGTTAIPCSGILTSPNMEGPYYTPGSPERSSLIEAGMPGTPILISGQVFDQDCNPISGASVDFWQADANGEYDNAGFRMRGHVITDQDGIYAMETIEPGLYTGRPAHIHIKVFAPDGRELLTTQMYFPGSENSPDVQAAPDLLVAYQGSDDQGRQQVFFNFVVQAQP